MHLDGFDGPFELLLALVSARRLDITEVSLAQVTDDFVAHLRAREDAGWDLSEASGFLVVAATLLDLKVAALLPRDERADGAALAEEALRLEARDLLFARLLEYRAFAAAGAAMGAALAAQGAHAPRDPRAEREPGGALHLAGAPLPPVELGTTPADLAALAAAALAGAALRGGVPGARRARRPAAVDLAHLHAPRASVPEQVALLGQRLRGAGGGAVGFEDLVADAEGVPVVVGRFLALLEMFRTGAVDLVQAGPAAPLTVRWVAV